MMQDPTLVTRAPLLPVEVQHVFFVVRTVQRAFFRGIYGRWIPMQSTNVEWQAWSASRVFNEFRAKQERGGLHTFLTSPPIRVNITGVAPPTVAVPLHVTEAACVPGTHRGSESCACWGEL
jgi:hypothetical protein